MEGWGGIALTAGLATGNLTQIYPNSVVAGDALPIAAGGKLLAPGGGRIGQVSIMTDATNGGTIELWDCSGLYVPVDVSSLTVITDAQLTTLKNKQRAKL